MSPILVVVALEVEQFRLQICCRQEESRSRSRRIANQPFNKGCENGAWHRFDFFHSVPVDSLATGGPIVIMIELIYFGIVAFESLD
jgi:hypothetical protein